MPSSSCFYLYTENLSSPVHRFLTCFYIQKGHLPKYTSAHSTFCQSGYSQSASLLGYEQVPIHCLLLRATSQGTCLTRLKSHTSVSYKSYENLFRFHIFSIYDMEAVATG